MKILRWILIGFFALTAQIGAANEHSHILETFGKAGASAFVDDAYGYAVFPTIGKGRLRHWWRFRRRASL